MLADRSNLALDGVVSTVMTTNEIVVGIDDSPSARAALRWAAEYARAMGAALRAIHVVDWPEGHDLYTYAVVADYVRSPSFRSSIHT
jgi:nucleotide-binding universal stress UspA family protein